MGKGCCCSAMVKKMLCSGQCKWKQNRKWKLRGNGAICTLYPVRCAPDCFVEGLVVGNMCSAEVMTLMLHTDHMHCTYLPQPTTPHATHATHATHAGAL